MKENKRKHKKKKIVEEINKLEKLKTKKKKKKLLFRPTKFHTRPTDNTAAVKPLNLIERLKQR